MTLKQSRVAAPFRTILAGASDFFDIRARAFVCATVSQTTVLLMPYRVLEFIL